MIKVINNMLKKMSIESIISKLAYNAGELKKYENKELDIIERKIRKELRAIEKASSMYFGNAKCLQRSILQYILLRKRYGLNVDIVIGVKKFPFSSHAWVKWHYTNKIACGAQEEIVGYDVIFSSEMVEV